MHSFATPCSSKPVVGKTSLEYEQTLQICRSKTVKRHVLTFISYTFLMCRVTAEEIYYTFSFSKLSSKDTHYLSATKVLSNFMELIIISSKLDSHLSYTISDVALYIRRFPIL